MFTPGTQVLAQWTDGLWYGAVVQEARDGYYLVLWHDGSPPSWLTPHQVTHFVQTISGSPQPTAYGAVNNNAMASACGHGCSEGINGFFAAIFQQTVVLLLLVIIAGLFLAFM